MIDHQLAATVKDRRARLLSLGRADNVILLGLHPEQREVFGIDLVAQPGVFLLLDEERDRP
jgi:hypothetical protein